MFLWLQHQFQFFCFIFPGPAAFFQPRQLEQPVAGHTSDGSRSRSRQAMHGGGWGAPGGGVHTTYTAPARASAAANPGVSGRGGPGPPPPALVRQSTPGLLADMMYNGVLLEVRYI